MLNLCGNIVYTALLINKVFPIFQTLSLFQIEDIAMQQQVESYKIAFRDWEDQQQRYRSALQARSAAAASGSGGSSSSAATASTAAAAAAAGATASATASPRLSCPARISQKSWPASYALIY